MQYDHVNFLIEQGLDNFLVEDTNGMTFAYLLQLELDQQTQDPTTLVYRKLI